ncbi:MAG: endonuclease domain-containing protein [Actinomycetota bacterium]|nr:endonuclease domain-containing protein [Actinomycetota bacterium]
MDVEAPDPDWFLDNVIVPAGWNRRAIGPALAWQGEWQADFNRILRTPGEAPLRRSLEQACRQGFVLTRTQARSLGMSDGTIRGLVGRGTWQRAAYGVLSVLASETTGGSGPDATGYEVRARLDRRRHALAATASALVHPGQVPSGASAAILHGLPVRAVPHMPEATCTQGGATLGRRTQALVRGATLGPPDLTKWFGVSVTSIARTIVDVARHDDRSGLMAADAALRERLVSLAEILAVVAQSAGWPGIRRAREVLQLTSALAESPLESITRLALHDSGMPPPELQAVVADPELGKNYRVDFLWRQQRLVLEADGRIKYSGGELWREKERELRLARLGFRVQRVIWDDVERNWQPTLDRIRWALASSPLG